MDLYHTLNHWPILFFIFCFRQNWPGDDQSPLDRVDSEESYNEYEMSIDAKSEDRKGESQLDPEAL